MSKYCMGHAYIKILFTVYLKLKSCWRPVFVFAKSGKPASLPSYQQQADQQRLCYSLEGPLRVFP